MTYVRINLNTISVNLGPGVIRVFIQHARDKITVRQMCWMFRELEWMFAMPQTVVMSKSGPKFTDIVLSLILRCVIRSSYDKSY